MLQRERRAEQPTFLSYIVKGERPRLRLHALVGPAHSKLRLYGHLSLYTLKTPFQQGYYYFEVNSYKLRAAVAAYANIGLTQNKCHSLRGIH